MRTVVLLALLCSLALAQPTADPDRDGIPTALEPFFGTDPTIPDFERRFVASWDREAPGNLSLAIATWADENALWVGWIVRDPEQFRSVRGFQAALRLPTGTYRCEPVLARVATVTVSSSGRVACLVVPLPVPPWPEQVIFAGRIETASGTAQYQAILSYTKTMMTLRRPVDREITQLEFWPAGRVLRAGYRQWDPWWPVFESDPIPPRVLRLVCLQTIDYLAQHVALVLDERCNFDYEKPLCPPDCASGHQIGTILVLVEEFWWR